MAHNLAISVLLLALATGAAAHGGHLHEYPLTPSGSNYIRTKIASCSSWVPGSGSVKYSLVSAAAASKPVVKGDATVWNYLYENCSLAEGAKPTAGVEFNVIITQDGKPLSNATLNGVVMTGSCASGGGTPYYFDPTADPLDDDENLLWFDNYTTKADGRVHGNGANDGDVVTSGPGSIKSVMLVNTLTNESLACCDLTLAGPADTNWSAQLQGKGVVCNEEDPHAGHDMSTMDGHNMSAMADMDHAANGNHSDHAGHDHSNMTATTAKSATSSAVGVAPAGAAVSAALGLAVVLALLL